MKRFLTFLAILILSAGLIFAQDDLNDFPEVFIPGSAGKLIIDFSFDIWTQMPGEIKINGVNRGINFSIFEDFKLGQSPFSFATGLGIASHNFYSDHSYVYYFNFGPSKSSQTGYFDFEKIDEDLADIKKNKLSLNYLNLPLELRYRNINLPKTFRVQAGLRLGYLINAHTKTHLVNEDGVFGPYSQTSWKYKENKLGNIQKFQAGISARVGYGRLNLFAYYPLTNIFKDNYPAENGMKPISVGISIIVF